MIRFTTDHLRCSLCGRVRRETEEYADAAAPNAPYYATCPYGGSIECSHRAVLAAYNRGGGRLLGTWHVARGHTTSCTRGSGAVNSAPMNLDEAKQEIARLKTIADGWKTIGSAFVAAAFGAEVEMGDVPPEELLQGVVAKSGDAPVNGTGHRHLDERHQQQVSAALLGRAYLLAPDTEEPEIHHTECSYPLCPNRRTERTMTEVEWSQPDKLATKARVCASVGGIAAQTGVCELWARWVAARVALGEVKLVP